MHSVLGNYKTMTLQYTVNVQRGYTCIQGVNSLYTKPLLTSLDSLCKDDQKCSLGIIQLSRLPLA